MNLKNLYLLISLTLASLSLFSQQCTNDSLTLYPTGDVNFVGQGFESADDLPCIQTGAYSEILIPFKGYNQGARLLTLPDSSTVPVSRIYAVHVENITNLPAGLCWTTRPSSGTVSGDEAGSLVIKGTTSVSTGIYPLNVVISISLSTSGSYTYMSLSSDNYKALLGQAILKVSDSNGICPSSN